MTQKQIVSEKKSGAKLSVRIVLLCCLALLLTAAFVRTHPRWKAAELTIEAAGRFFEIEDLEPDGVTLETRILPPEGYTRVPAEEGSFAEYLRQYPLMPDDTKIPAYDGSTINSTDVACIFDISLGNEGYQQCADSVIRLYSDYFYETGQYERISFQFSNGDECSYNNWCKGKRMLVLGGLSCELPAALPGDSRQKYMNYLKEVMRYAGTISLLNESEVIPAGELRTGDIICNEGHVVMIADTAVNDRGEKCYLIGQSFIPAVCFHILTHAEGKTVSPWFTQEQLSKERFSLGGFSFNQNAIRRWKEGF